MLIFDAINEAHKQYSLLDTVFNYIFIFDLQEHIYKQVEKTDYPQPASPADASSICRT